MKATFFKLSLICLVAFAMTSCNKTTIEPTKEAVTELTASVTSRNGHLVFKDRESYKTTFDYFLAHQNELEEWSKHFADFTSFSEKYDQLTEADMLKIAETKSIKGYENLLTLEKEADGSLQVVKNVGNNFLSNILNQDGIVQIGDNYVKFLHDKTLTANFSSISLAEMEVADEKTQVSNIHTSNIAHNVLNETRSFSATSAANYTQGAYNKRLLGEIYTDRIYNWSTLKYDEIHVNASIKHQKKVLGVWYTTTTTSLRMFTPLNVSQWASFTSNGIADASSLGVALQSGWMNNQSSLDLLICGKIDTGKTVDLNHIKCSVEHGGVCNDGVTRACTTNANQ